MRWVINHCEIGTTVPDVFTFENFNGPQNISDSVFFRTDCVRETDDNSPLLMAGWTVIITRFELSEPLHNPSSGLKFILCLHPFPCSLPGSNGEIWDRNSFNTLNFLKCCCCRHHVILTLELLSWTEVWPTVMAGQTGRSVGVFEERLRPSVCDATSSWRQGEQGSNTTNNPTIKKNYTD